MCAMCEKYDNALKVLTCGICQGYYHWKGISKSHQKNYDSQTIHPLSLIHEKCYIIYNQSDEQIN